MPKDGNFETMYQLLFSVVLFSGIFLPLIGGAVIDRMGGGICLLTVATSCFIGHVIASVGVTKESWAILLAGRFIFGLGVECEIVALQALMAEWFGKEHVGMALALVVTCAYIGFFVSFLLCPIVANRVDLSFAFWLGTMVKAVSVLAAFALFSIIRKKGQVSHEITTSTSRHEGEIAASEIDKDIHNTSVIERVDGNYQGKVLQFFVALKFNTLFWLLCLSSLLQYSVNLTFYSAASGALLERNLFIKQDKGCILEYPDQCSSGYLAPEGGNQARDPNGDLCKVADKYAPVLPNSINITGHDPSWDDDHYLFFPLNSDDVDCTDDFWSEACASNYCDEQETATEKAGLLMALPSIVLVATMYLFGRYGVDKYGLRCEMILLAPTLVVIAQAMFAFQDSSPILPLVLQGIGYSLVSSSLWPCIPLAVPATSVGRAFGLSMCIQNIGLTCFPLIVAAIHGMHDRYLPEVSVFFMSCAAASVLLALVLLLWNKKCGGQLSTRNDSTPASIHPMSSLHSIHSLHQDSRHRVHMQSGD